MIFEELSFHDSTILGVRENPSNQTIDFFLTFPINWQENKFEKRLLRFNNVLVYIKKEIPFSGNPVILEIDIKSNFKHSFNSSFTEVTTSKIKIEMITNAGIRILEFSDAEFLQEFQF